MTPPKNSAVSNIPVIRRSRRKLNSDIDADIDDNIMFQDLLNEINCDVL